MAAWCRLTLLFLFFYEVLAIKVNVRGANHICASGAQVFHVNFGNGPIHQCDVMNTTPPSKNGKPSCAEKAKEQLKSSQGLYDSGKWGVSYHVNNLVNYTLPFLNMLSCSFCPFMFSEFLLDNLLLARMTFAPIFCCTRVCVKLLVTASSEELFLYTFLRF